MSDIWPPVGTEDELQVEEGADPAPPEVEVQDDGTTPEPDQVPDEEDDS